MKKLKQRGGYVLPAVVALIAVLGILITGTLSATMNNLQAQSAAANRLAERYEALGQAEKLCVILDTAGKNGSYGFTHGELDYNRNNEEEQKGQVIGFVERELQAKIQGMSSDGAFGSVTVESLTVTGYSDIDGFAAQYAEIGYYQTQEENPDFDPSQAESSTNVKFITRSNPISGIKYTIPVKIELTFVSDGGQKLETTTEGTVILEEQTNYAPALSVDDTHFVFTQLDFPAYTYTTA